MNNNAVIPVILFLLMIGIWVLVERRSSFGIRVAVGLTCFALCGVFAVIVASVEEAIIARHVSAIMEVDDRLSRQDHARVEMALAAYRERYEATNDPKAAVFAFHDAIASWRGSE